MLLFTEHATGLRLLCELSRLRWTRTILPSHNIPSEWNYNAVSATRMSCKLRWDFSRLSGLYTTYTFHKCIRVLIELFSKRLQGCIKANRTATNAHNKSKGGRKCKLWLIFWKTFLEVNIRCNLQTFWLLYWGIFMKETGYSMRIKVREYNVALIVYIINMIQ